MSTFLLALAFLVPVQDVPHLVTPAPLSVAQAAGDDGARVHGEYSYVLDPDGSDVDVVVEIDIEATRPDERTDAGVYQYYLFEYQMVVPAAAVELDIADRSGSLSIRRNPFDVEGFDLVTVKLRSRVFYGQSTTVTARYSLPDDLANFRLESAETAVIVNPASAGWFVFTDGGLDSWQATIEAPDGYELISRPDYPSPFSRSDGAETSTTVLEASGASDGLFTFVLFEREAGMVEQSITAHGTDIVLRYWPGDEQWLDHVTGEIDDHLGSLRELIDRPWPDRELTIQESAVPLGSSYAGWYIEDENLIVIGPRIDDLTVLHEIAHVWINHRSLSDRWVIEGLASEFAALAVADGEPSEASLVSLDDEVARPLSGWDSQDPEVESWEYDASWQLLRTIRSEIGTEAFLSAVRARLAGRSPYGDLADTSAGGSESFRLLDYFEQAAPDAALADMVATWVDGGWNESYEQRQAALKNYRSLQTDAGDWHPPLVVRNALATWSFDQAETAMSAATAVVKQRDDLADALVVAELDVPMALEQAFEQAASAEDVAEVGEQLVASGALVLELDSVDQSLSLVERFGLAGGGLDHDRQLVRALYTTGQFDEMNEASARLDDAVDAAERSGQRRIAGVGGGLLLLGAGGGLRRWRQRRSRRR